MATPSVSEILSKASEIKKIDERVSFLRQHSTKPVLDVLKATFDPRVKWLLPEGAPPYKPNEDAVNTHNVLLHETRKFYLFIETPWQEKANLHQLRREVLFVQLLESLHPADAELMVSVKDKKLPYKGITPKVVEEAFPGLL